MLAPEIAWKPASARSTNTSLLPRYAHRIERPADLLRRQRGSDLLVRERRRTEVRATLDGRLRHRLHHVVCLPAGRGSAPAPSTATRPSAGPGSDRDWPASASRRLPDPATVRRTRSTAPPVAAEQVRQRRPLRLPPADRALVLLDHRGQHHRHQARSPAGQPPPPPRCRPGCACAAASRSRPCRAPSPPAPRPPRSGSAAMMSLAILPIAPATIAERRPRSRPCGHARRARAGPGPAGQAPAARSRAARAARPARARPASRPPRRTARPAPLCAVSAACRIWRVTSASHRAAFSPNVIGSAC